MLFDVVLCCNEFSVSDSLLLHVVPCCLILHLNTLAEVFYILIGCWFVRVKIMV